MTKRRTKCAGSRKKPQPLVAPFRSRKKARQVTTLFHRYTRQREEALLNGQDVTAIDEKIEEMGGRRAYQKASQVSTSYHSTSRWVLSVLAQRGLLLLNSNRPAEAAQQQTTMRLFEVGAINTELLDAADATKMTRKGHKGNGNELTITKKYRLEVRAIDLHSMHERIEEADFLQLPLPESTKDQYDVIVCSMVLNCVATPAARGQMLARLSAFCRPGGLVFLTIPKTCLDLSPYMDRKRMEGFMQVVGLQVLEHSKDSPKVAYFIGQQPKNCDDRPKTYDNKKWSELTVIRQGKKFKNDFAITLTKQDVDANNVCYNFDL